MTGPQASVGIEGPLKGGTGRRGRPPFSSRHYAHGQGCPRSGELYDVVDAHAARRSIQNGPVPGKYGDCFAAGPELTFRPNISESGGGVDCRARLSEASLNLRSRTGWSTSLLRIEICRPSACRCRFSFSLSLVAKKHLPCGTTNDLKQSAPRQSLSGAEDANSVTPLLSGRGL